MRAHLGVLVFLVTVAFGAEPNPVWRSSALSVRHSDVALMPEGTPPDYAAFAPVRATLMVWGEEGLPALDGGEAAMKKLRANTAAYRQLGIREIATNLWMLTATERYLHAHPELGEASCVDLWGGRIVPRWLSDADFKGTKAWWGCTNQPRFQAQLLARFRAGLAAGATMVHLDDHSGTYACAASAGGCFCDECRRGFREWLVRNVAGEPHPVAGGLRSPVGSALTADLRSAGVDPAALERFDYAEFLRATWEGGRAARHADREAFIKETWAQRVPLWPWFLAYQREAALGFIARIRTEASATLKRDVPVGVNAYNLDPKQLFDAAEIDYFANEVEHWDHEDLIAPLTYRLGEALGRPTFVTGSGDDWIAYRKAGATQRVRGWIAQAYAFGQYFMYSWNKWGYSDETGTLWTQVPTSVYEPYTSFVRDHPQLFDGLENVASVGLLYDNASANRGKWQVREASKALLDAGVPYRLVVRGDAVLRFPDEAPTSQLRTLVLPSDLERTPDLEAWLKEWEATGTRVVRGVATPTGERSPPATQDGTPPATQVARGLRSPDGDVPQPSIHVKSTGRVWALPRVGPRLREPGSDAPQAVIHLLNREYTAAGDSFRKLEAFEVDFDAASVGGFQPRAALYHAPGRAATKLEITSAAGRSRVVVPALEIWGVIALE